MPVGVGSSTANATASAALNLLRGNPPALLGDPLPPLRLG